jgi:uncharacterized membrane protein
MKSLKTALIASTIALISSPVLAAGYVDTSRTYSSGLLVGLFLGFCALIVVMQLIPSIIMLVGFIKAAVTKSKPKRQGVGVR